MECSRCAHRLTATSKRVKVTPTRAFSSSPSHSRLGAASYPQEWNIGSYHFNKATTKTLPVALSHTNDLLTNFMTQTKKRAGVNENSDIHRQVMRNQIAAQRRQTESILVSKATAKDFGERVEVTAFVHDGVQAMETEMEKRRKARMGLKAEGDGQTQKRGPVRRRRGAGAGVAGAGAGPGAGGADAGAPRRFAPRTGGGMGRPGAAGGNGGSDGGTRVKRLTGIGSANASR